MKHTTQAVSSGGRKKRDYGSPVLKSGGAAVVMGLISSMMLASLAANGPHWSDGIQLSLYMSASILLASVFGIVFALPRAREGAVPIDTERYAANSNLEQISDWLTKILVGAGLVQLTSLPQALRELGDYLGESLALPNAEAASLAMSLYGFGVGFVFAYLWTRLFLRSLFEASEVDAQAMSTRDQIVEAMTGVALKDSDQREAQSAIIQAADEVGLRADRSRQSPRSVLWVDDHPENNAQIVETLRNLPGRAIGIDLAASTNQALRLMDQNHDLYGLVITDMARVEDGIDDERAGLRLLRAVRERSGPPVIVYAGAGAIRHRDELLAEGAVYVTHRPSELLAKTVELLLPS